MNRTIKISLYLSKEQEATLKDTSLKYAQVFNKVVDYSISTGVTNGVELHRGTYKDFSNREFLPSQLICSARVKATEALKSFRTKSKKRTIRVEKQKEQGKKRLLKSINKPRSKGLLSIRYDARSFSIDFKTNIIGLASTSGRIKIPFKTAQYYWQYTNGKVCSADLVYSKDKKRFFVNVVMEFPDTMLPDPIKILGVDLGINNLAVSSDNKFYLRPDLRNISNRYQALRGRLQSKGTRSAKRHLKKLSGCENRFHRDVNHCVSKNIVRSAKLQGYDTIAIENLKHIRENSKLGRASKARLSSWSFAQLQTFLTYKAASAGIQVEVVSAKYTSQGCSRCGHIYKPQRKGNEFHCVNCDYRNHSDLNASFNISKNFQVSRGLSSGAYGDTFAVCGPSVQPAYCDRFVSSNTHISNHKPTNLFVGS